MKKYIVITSIFPPTKAINEFSKLQDYHIIVVGDKKSPPEYLNSKVLFLSVEAQSELGYSILHDLPFNHYCRKNIGYLFAIHAGADLIIDTDDDNIPYPDWSFPEFSGVYDYINPNMGFINIYNLFTDQEIWPRGLPLSRVKVKLNHSLQVKQFSKVGIWQGLADGDPDVDAIYRLVYNNPCYFNKREPVLLGNGTISPFNSQNTAFRKELFPLLYLPSTVTFRFTDILRGLIAQPIMWLYDYSLGYTQATVLQERNPHDYMKDFESEIPCFLKGNDVIDMISAKISSSWSVCENLLVAYEELFNAGIVGKNEVGLAKSWIDDIQKHV